MWKHFDLEITTLEKINYYLKKRFDCVDKVSVSWPFISTIFIFEHAPLSLFKQIATKLRLEVVFKTHTHYYFFLKNIHIRN